MVPMHYNNIIPEIDSIYKASTRHHGVFNPNAPTKEKQCWASKAPVTENDWIMHLSGRRGLGLAPILDDDTCRWAAIDVDNHADSGGGVPIEEIAKLLAMHGFPGIAGRSKSGSVHIYMFFGPDVTAYDARRMMVKWSEAMFLTQFHPRKAMPERFPKQNMLGDSAWPSWINLPYFGITDDNPYGDRYAFLGGKKLTVEEFIAWAKDNIIWRPDVDKHIKYESPTPCVLAFQYHQVPEGGRNNALYNAALFIGQAFPKQFLEKLREFNLKAFYPPLPDSEVVKMVDRLRRGAKSGYLCKEYPANEFCNREQCAKLKYGQVAILEKLGPDQRTAAGEERRKKNIQKQNHEFWDIIKEHFKFNSLTRFAYENVTFVLDCSLNEKDKATDTDNWKEYSITLTATDLIKYDRVRVLVLEQMNYGLPMLKSSVWNEIVNELILGTKNGLVTDDATPMGVMRRNLIKFIRTGDLSASGEAPRYNDVEQGRPFIYLDNAGKKRVAFSFGDLVEYLENNRRPPIEENNLLKNLFDDVGCQVFDIHNQKKNLWTCPFNPRWDASTFLTKRST